MPSIPSFQRLRVARVLFLGVCLVLVTTSAQAYTVVLRSGRTVEIPGSFTVTSQVLTYEAGPGIQVSLQLATVDIPATERANRETAGSFLSRIQSTPRGVEPRQNQAAERSITNKDLERFARSRQQSELAYERRRKELGLPSVEESRQRAAAEAIAMRERFEQSQREDKAGEAYWRERAIALKSDIAAADAEINSLRQQIDWLPSPNSLPSVTVTSGLVPLLPSVPLSNAVINTAFATPLVAARRPVFVTPNRGQRSNARANIGPIFTPGRNFGNRFFGPRRFNRFNRVGLSPYSVFPDFSTFGYPYDLAYDRTVLITRLNEVIAQRAALQARWRALEDEARMAGAMPGWLRP